MPRILLRGLSAFVVVSSLDCGGDGLPRQGVRGTITLDGRPLETGRVAFLPSDPNRPGIGAEATVTAGAYEVPVATGPLPGAYRVVVSAPVQEARAAAPARPAGKTFEATGGTGAADAPEEPVLRETIPARYNAQSTLSAEVKPGGENVFDFGLTSK